MIVEPPTVPLPSPLVLLLPQSRAKTHGNRQLRVRPYPGRGLATGFRSPTLADSVRADANCLVCPKVHSHNRMPTAYGAYTPSNGSAIRPLRNRYRRCCPRPAHIPAITVATPEYFEDAPHAEWRAHIAPFVTAHSVELAAAAPAKARLRDAVREARHRGSREAIGRAADLTRQSAHER